LKKLDEAIADYKTYLRLNNGNISARVRYAAFLFLAGKHQDALTEIEDIEKTNPNMLLVKRIRGYCEYELGQFDKARVTLEWYFSKQTENKFIWSDYDYMGKSLLKTGGDSLSIDFFIKLLIKDPTKRTVVGEVGANLYKDKKYRLALRLFEAIVKLAKPECNDYFYIGKSAEKVNLLQKADTAYTKYIECNSEVYQGYWWRGKVRAMMDSKTETWAAKPDYEKAIELAEKLDSIKLKASLKEIQYCYFYLGSYYWLKEKNFPMAKCYFSKLVAKCLELEKGKEAAGFLESRQELKNAVLPEDCK
ncbi:MAG: tetratricopeptide repeat protein, partial [Flavobacteriales bacterium]